jgi:hypothetical protein
LFKAGNISIFYTESEELKYKRFKCDTSGFGGAEVVAC